MPDENSFAGYMRRLAATHVLHNEETRDDIKCSDFGWPVSDYCFIP